MAIELPTLLGKGLVRRTSANFIDLSTIEAIDSVASAAARLAIPLADAPSGRVVRQTAGYNAGYYVADGTGSWQLIGSALERTAMHVDVRDFGAACDGVFDNNTGTDDTVALNAAIQACQSTGRILYLPGICKVSDEIICTGRIRFDGAEKGGIRQTDPAARCLVFAPTTNSVPQSIENMILGGGLISLDWSNENGATVTHSVHCYMRRCEFYPAGGVGSKGIHIGISHIGCHHFMLFIYGGAEYSIDASNGVTDLLGNSTWDNVNITGGVGSIYGVRAIGAGAPVCHWKSLIIESCDGGAMYLRDADFTIHSGHFENNGVAAEVPDITMNADGPGGGTCKLTLMNTTFSGRGAGQINDKRIALTSSHCQLSMYNTYMPPPNKIDVASAGSACAVDIHGLGQPLIVPTEDAITIHRHSVEIETVATLATDVITGRLNGSVAVSDPISGVLEFVHGTPSTDLRPGIAANANARTLALGINVLEIGGTVDAVYDSAALRLETRSSSGLFTWLGCEAGESVDVLFKMGARGYYFRRGAMAVAGATGARTIHRGCGSIRIAAGQQTAVLTNELIKTGGILNTQVYAQLMTDDLTAKSVIVTRGASHSATFKLNAAATAEVEIAWFTVDCEDDVTGGGGINGGQLDFSRAINSGHI